MLLILAGVSLSAVFSESGIFSRAEKAGNKYNEAKARETLETVLLGIAQYEKRDNPKYDQEEFLDKLIKKEIEGADVTGDVAIVGGWGFELDRSVPKIKTDLGQADKLVFPTVTVSEAQVASDGRTATFKVTALEETNGINKIEIWLNGEKIDKYDKEYSNQKIEITEDFNVNRNGTYIVKVYGELMASKTVKVEGLVPAVKFTPNGSNEWKREHSTTIKAEQTGETITEIKYLWKIGENEPQTREFTEDCTDNSTITGKELTGKYHLWILLKTESGKINVCGSNEFWFDNEGPEVTLTSDPTSETSFTLTATAEDTKSGIAKYEFYIDDKKREPDNITDGIATYTWTGTEMVKDKNCYVIVSDKLNNKSEKIDINARTILYTWESWNCVRKGHYEEKSWETTMSPGPTGTGYVYGAFTSYSFNKETGKYTLYNDQGGSWRPTVGRYLYWRSMNSGSSQVVSSMHYCTGQKSDNEYNCIYYTSQWVSDGTEKGTTRYGVEQSTTTEGYPEVEGEKDNKWLVYIGKQ